MGTQAIVQPPPNGREITLATSNNTDLKEALVISKLRNPTHTPPPSRRETTLATLEKTDLKEAVVSSNLRSPTLYVIDMPHLCDMICVMPMRS